MRKFATAENKGPNSLHANADNNGLSKEGRHRLIHQRVILDEVDSDVGQGARVVDARAGPRLRHLLRRHRQPVGVHCLLLFELALERTHHLVHAERAHRRSADGVDRRREHSVHQRVDDVAVLAVDDVARRLCKSFGN
jgi:hypothetical protein